MSKTKIVIVGAGVIGLATARLRLEKGYRVVGISRRGRVDALDSDGFVGIELDLGDLARVESSLKTIVAEHRIDGLVHAAGQGLFGSIEQFSLAQIENLLRVNLASAMVISRALLPTLRRRGQGRLIFIGSESALEPGRKGALYCATKFGLRGFCLSLREDCASDGVQVSLVNPGMVRSPFFDELSFAPAAGAENAIEPEDVAAAVWHILQAGSHIVVDEIRLSPRVKSIDFGRKA